MSRRGSASTPKPVIISPAALLVLALFEMPHGYYTLLRIVVFAAAAWIAFVDYQDGLQWRSSFFALIAVLFNPVIPIDLDRETWSFIDAGVAAAFLSTLISWDSVRLPKRRGVPPAPIEPRSRSKAMSEGIAAAKALGAIKPREAASIVVGRPLSDDEWSACRLEWEEEWRRAESGKASIVG